MTTCSSWAEPPQAAQQLTVLWGLYDWLPSTPHTPGSLALFSTEHAGYPSWAAIHVQLTECAHFPGPP